MADLEIIKFLGIALAIGLLIGLERGWSDRNEDEGRRIAGVRTFGLIGLLGGIVAYLAQPGNVWILGVAFLGLAVVLTAAYLMRLRVQEDIGITSLIAALLTFCLGALAVAGHIYVTISAAVVISLLLGIKSQLHDLVHRLERVELYATLKLLLISVVLIPLLPNRGYGPWQMINPFEIWWMVVLVAGISYVGYFAMKIGGPRYGILATGIFGGLASSTAVTLTLSRMARENTRYQNTLAAGILAACGTMYPRVLLVSALINPAVALRLAAPLLVTAVLTYGTALVLWQKHSSKSVEEGDLLVKNPFQLSMALQFGLLLAIIMLLSKLLQVYLGEAGVYLLSAFSGLTDVDAITLSMARMSGTDLTIAVASLAIFIAAATNSLVKGGLALGVGRKDFGLKVAGPLVISVIVGVGVYFVQ
tara:strand:- start:12050 stop:13306 length:1257 start_codon:yes stop_codon:yes gene_type:complete